MVLAACSLSACPLIAGPQIISSSTRASGHTTRRGSRLLCNAEERKKPSSDPNYRRQGSNEHWRKRADTGRSTRGKSVDRGNDKRRRGRPAHMRSPDDTPLRDGNRDRLMGLLTDRATRTLEHTVGEENPMLNCWLNLYRQENAIPKDGNWSDVSGENFLRTLLTRPVEEISGSFSDEEPQFANASPIGGDPRLVAQKIMDYRHAIAKEWIEELKQVADENKLLLSESLMSSLSMGSSEGSGKGSSSDSEGGDGVGGGGGSSATQGKQAQQEPQPDDSAAGGDD